MGAVSQLMGFFGVLSAALVDVRAMQDGADSALVSEAAAALRVTAVQVRLLEGHIDDDGIVNNREQQRAGLRAGGCWLGGAPCDAGVRCQQC